MRSLTRLCSVIHRLTSIFFSSWLPHAFKIILLSSILLLSAWGRAITDYKYNAMIKKRTSRFVYGGHKKHYYFSSRPSSTAEPPLECAICLLEFVDGEVGTKLESCGHRFHATCVEKWLMHGKGHASCPLCRVPVVQEGVAEEHRKLKSDGRLLTKAFREELGILLLPGLRYVSCCQVHKAKWHMTLS